MLFKYFYGGFSISRGLTGPRGKVLKAFKKRPENGIVEYLGEDWTFIHF
jgi:hypothetical protein